MNRAQSRWLSKVEAICALYEQFPLVLYTLNGQMVARATKTAVATILNVNMGLE